MRRVLRYLTILMIVAVVSLGTFVTIEAAAISSMSPTSGFVGTNVTLSGTSAGATDSVTIEYDGTSVDTTTASSSSWSGSFLVPRSIAGIHSITATDSGGTSPARTFTVRPKIAVTQPAGGVTINGTGFGASESITINIDATQGVPTATTDDTGSFDVTGLSVVAGSHTFEAINADASHDATATFTVVSHSTIALGKTSGPVGTSVTINGAGFAANETSITVTFDGSQIGATTSASFHRGLDADFCYSHGGRWTP